MQKQSLKGQVRELKNQWRTKKVLEIQQPADCKGTNQLQEKYQRPKPTTLHGPYFLYSIDEESYHGSCSPSRVFAWLRRRVFENHNLKAKTKFLVLKLIVQPTLLNKFSNMDHVSRQLKALEAH